MSDGRNLPNTTYPMNSETTSPHYPPVDTSNAPEKQKENTVTTSRFTGLLTNTSPPLAYLLYQR